jgi:protein gp37
MPPSATGPNRSTAGKAPHGFAVNLHQTPETALGILTTTEDVLRRIQQGGTNVQTAINATRTLRQDVAAKINDLRNLPGEIRIPIHMSRRITFWKR